MSETPKKGYRNIVLLLLTLVELGLLIGLAFAAFYTILGIPLAFLADRMNRVSLLSLALVTWSGFTALTGFAQNFLHIALARVGVGIGEAGGSPPSHSMISDFYAKNERAGALGIYSLGIPLGVMSAYFLTAVLLGEDPSTVNWRRIFIILGITGIILALIVKLVIKEPTRGAMESGAKPASGYISFPESWKQSNIPLRTMIFGALFAILWIGHLIPTVPAVPILFAVLFSFFLIMMFALSLQPGVLTILSIKSWWWMALGIAFASFASYAISGFQTKYLRLLDPDFSFRTIVIWIGIINGTFYVAGTYFGAKLVDWRAKKDVRAYGTIPAISILLAFPFAMGAFWAPTVTLHLVIGAALQLCLGVYLGPSFAIAQTLAPISLRAMSTALFFFVLNMIALGGGPTFAGAMIDFFGGKGAIELEATRMALYVTFGAYVLAFIFFMLVRVTLPKDWKEAEVRNAADMKADVFE